jgi:hypothetical protein
MIVIQLVIGWFIRKVTGKSHLVSLIYMTLNSYDGQKKFNEFSQTRSHKKVVQSLKDLSHPDLKIFIANIFYKI